MPRYLEKLDATGVEFAHDHYKDIWSETHEKWRVLDDYYNLSWEIWGRAFQNLRSTYHPSRARSVVDHANDALMNFFPRVRRDPVGETDSHKDSAARVAGGLKAILNDSALEETMLTWKQIGHNFVHLGYAVVDGPTLDFEDLPIKPKAKKDGESNEDFEIRETLYQANRRNWNPVRIRPTHPASVLMDPLQKKPREAIKITEHYADDLHELSTRKKARLKGNGDILDMRGMQPYEKLELIEYWNMGYHIVKVKGGQHLYTEKNTYRFVPFAHAYAGFGMEQTDYKENDPKYLAVGLLDPIKETLTLQAQSHSAKHTLLMRTAYALEGTTQDPEEVAQMRAEGKLMQGESSDYWIMDTQQVPASMFQEDRQFDTDIELGTFSSALGGRRQQGVSTVGQEAILNNNALRKFAGTSVQHEHLASITAGRILQLIDIVPRLKDGIGSNGEHIRRSDIYHAYHAHVSFEINDPVIDLQRQQQGMAEVQGGIQSPEDYLQHDKRVEDVQEYMKNMDKHRVRQTPEVWAIRGQATADAMGEGFGEAFASVQESQGLGPNAQNGAPPNGLPPNGLPPSGPQPVAPLPNLASADGAAAAELRQPLTARTAKPGLTELGS